MKLRFLGTSAAGGYPNPHCRCENCVAARVTGGKSIRMECSALINDDLLIDLGPDANGACVRFGWDLAGVRWTLQTHDHGDHLLTMHMTSRAATWAAQNAEPMTWYMNSHARDYLLASDTKTISKLRMAVDTDAPAKLTVRTIDAWQTLKFGPYEVLTIPANHTSAMNPLIFAIRQGDRSMLWGSDTSSLPAEIWPQVASHGWKFDLVVFDHNDGFARAKSATHMGSAAALAEFVAMKSLGLVDDATQLFGTHLAHHSNSTHEVEEAQAAALGYHIAYDGLTVDL